jgi:hypothetical protein
LSLLVIARSRAAVGAAGDLPQQLAQQLAEAFPQLWSQIGPPKLSEALEVQLCCPSSGHGVEPPRS